MDPPPTCVLSLQHATPATRWNRGTIFLKIRRPNSGQADVDIPIPYGQSEPHMETLRLDFEDIFAHHLIRFGHGQRMLDKLSTYVRMARLSAEEQGVLPKNINFTIIDQSSYPIPSMVCVQRLRHMEATKRMADETEAKATCSICIEDVGTTEHINVLNCGHFFHSECITTWFYSEFFCPICRSEDI